MINQSSVLEHAQSLASKIESVKNWIFFPSEEMTGTLPKYFQVVWNEKGSHFNIILMKKKPSDLEGYYVWDGRRLCSHRTIRSSYDHWRIFDLSERVRVGLLTMEVAVELLRLRERFLPYSRALSDEQLIDFSRNHSVCYSKKALVPIFEKQTRWTDGKLYLKSDDSGFVGVREVSFRKPYVVHSGHRGLFHGYCLCYYTVLPRGEYYERFFGSWSWSSLHELHQTTNRLELDEDAIEMKVRCPYEGYLNERHPVIQWMRLMRIRGISDASLERCSKFFDLVERKAWLRYGSN